MSDPDPAHPTPSSAGAYGFTRREIVALIVMMALCIGILSYDRWRDREARDMPAWAIEDVVVEQPEEAIATRSTDSVMTSDSATARPRRDFSDNIDINTADVRTLARLPGIGPTLARRIIEERETKGAFLNLIDLQRVNGIGPRKAAMLSGWVTFTQPQLATDSSEAP